MPEITIDMIVGALQGHPTMPIPAYRYHTGGGIWVVQVDVAPEGGTPKADDPYLWLSPREDYDGQPGVAIGYYFNWEDVGAWPGTNELRCVETLPEIHAVIAEGCDLMCKGVRP